MSSTTVPCPRRPARDRTEDPTWSAPPSSRFDADARRTTAVRPCGAIADDPRVVVRTGAGATDDWRRPAAEGVTVTYVSSRRDSHRRSAAVTGGRADLRPRAGEGGEVV
jgi:hypothetical protein